MTIVVAHERQVPASLESGLVIPTNEEDTLPGFLSIQDCVLAILAKLQHLSILTFLAAQPQVV